MFRHERRVAMYLRQLRCFIAVAEEMHFGRASERLHMAPTALSRLIRTLESEIGVTLLTRTTRAVTLTRAGLGFLDDAKGILARTEDAARNARETAEGSGLQLRIGAIDSASASFLPAALNALRAKYPTVNIQLSEAMTAPQLQMLRTGRLDLALIRAPSTASEFPFEVLRVERLVALLPVNHRLAGSNSILIADLAGDPVIIPAKRARPYAYDVVMAAFADVGLVPRILQETTEKPAMLAMVAANMGVALVPDWVAALSRPGVCFRPLQKRNAKNAEPLPGAIVGMAWRDRQKHAIRDEFLGILRTSAKNFDPTIILD
jgi:DNA-binding transcriptional LysR family regulator